jgi:aldehyde dehydrogenase (NAD+)
MTTQHSNYIAAEWEVGTGISRGTPLGPERRRRRVRAGRPAADRAGHRRGARGRPGLGRVHRAAARRRPGQIGGDPGAQDELGTLLSRKEGKTLPEGIGDVVHAGNIVKFSD